MHSFDYQQPRSMAEALDLLSAYGHEAYPLAGGTDLIVGLRSGRSRPRVVVDVKRLADLGPAIDVANGRFSITAPTTLREVISDTRIRSCIPSLVEAARTVGSVQIRSRATLIGNICNASPAADTAPPMLAHNAEVALISREGSRRLPLEDFMVGPRRTALQPGEMVTAIEIRVPAPSTASSFVRLTRRRGVDLAIVSVSCTVAGTVTTLAFGAVGPKPFAISDDSGVLADPNAAADARIETLRTMVAHAAPISDVRGSREYRQAMLLALSQRALQIALRRRVQSDGDV